MSIERTELSELKRQGIPIEDPFDAVELFETAIAEFSGAKFGVAVDCATHAIELCLRFKNASGSISVPCWTYPSIPMAILKVNASVEWTEEKWQGEYQIGQLGIWDASTRFRPGMYRANSLYCLSFQQKKRLGIGRGGMVLTDDIEAYDWLKKASYDGRERGRPWKDDPIESIGYHYYMTPEDAARGLLLFRQLTGPWPDSASWQNYPDLRTFPVFSKQEEKVER